MNCERGAGGRGLACGDGVGVGERVRMGECRWSVERDTARPIGVRSLSKGVCVYFLESRPRLDYHISISLHYFGPNSVLSFNPHRSYHTSLDRINDVDWGFTLVAGVAARDWVEGFFSSKECPVCRSLMEDCPSA